MIAFFFDIDGTLLPFGRSVPESTVRAIRDFRKKGNKAFLATGRSVAEILPEISAIGFDGGVFAAGAHVIADGMTVYRRTMTEDEKEELFSFCRSRGFRLLVQTNDGTYMNQEALDLWSSLLLKHVGRPLDVPGMKIADELPSGAEINKLLYISEGGCLEEIQRSIPPRFTAVCNTVGLPGDLMGEIVLSDITKATGMDRMLEHYGMDVSRAAAIGDGANDIEMVEHAGIGIAMGNASADLKEAADYVTADIDDDGLAKAIEYVINTMK